MAAASHAGSSAQEAKGATGRNPNLWEDGVT